MSYNQGTNQLLSNVSADTTGSAVAWPGGAGVFSATATTWGSGTVTLQWLRDGASVWLPVDRSGDVYCTLTANGSGQFFLPKCSIRAVLSGSTSPAAVNAYADSITA